MLLHVCGILSWTLPLKSASRLYCFGGCGPEMLRSAINCRVLCSVSSFHVPPTIFAFTSNTENPGTGLSRKQSNFPGEASLHLLTRFNHAHGYWLGVNFLLSTPTGVSLISVSPPFVHFALHMWAKTAGAFRMAEKPVYLWKQSEQLLNFSSSKTNYCNSGVQWLLHEGERSWWTNFFLQYQK